MALDISILPPALELDEVHTSTIILVSREPDFSTLIIDYILTLPNSLTFKTYDIEFVPGETYYVRVRAILTPGGMQGISATTFFVAEDSNDLTLHMNPPASVNPPTLSLIGGVENTDVTNLKFELSIDLNVPHSIRQTSWILVDSNNTTRFHSMNDTTNLYNIVVDTLLKQNEYYIMRAMVTLDTGATSMYGSICFNTGDYPGGKIAFDPAYGNLNIPLEEPIEEAHLLPVIGSSSKDITIYNTDGILKTMNITGDVIDLYPEVEDIREYVIKVEANMVDGSSITPVYQHIYVESTFSYYPKVLPVNPE